MNYVLQVMALKSKQMREINTENKELIFIYFLLNLHKTKNCWQSNASTLLLGKLMRFLMKELSHLQGYWKTCQLSVGGLFILSSELWRSIILNFFNSPSENCNCIAKLDTYNESFSTDALCWSRSSSINYLQRKESILTNFRVVSFNEIYLLK